VDLELMPLTKRSGARRSRALVMMAGLTVTSAGAAAGQTLRMVEPTVIVTAQKEPADIQHLPLSVTAVSGATLIAEDITSISEAAIYAPNTFFSEFSARKLSFPVFRGVSGGPGNPAITTYVDGVPMIHSNVSNVELIDVEQVEFVRGAQGALYGRNALGGIINVSSNRPSLMHWTGNASSPIGNDGQWDLRGAVSGPVSSRAAIGVAGGRSQRDGFTTNGITGNDVDYRANSFGKVQLLWTPAEKWEARVLVGGERARDGDYALNDLGVVRQAPFEVQRDLEGHTDRDVVSATFLVRHEGPRVTLSSTTGLVNWSTADLTDLDYSPLPLVTRTNDESALQFSQEIRFASATAAPIHLSDSATLRWQGGVFFFSQGYDQDAVNNYSPFVLSPFIPLPVQQHSPQSALDDKGLGIYGQGTVTFSQRIDATLGARVDYESKDATLRTFYAPPIAQGTDLVTDDSFSNVSPQASLAYHLQPDRMLYATFGGGYKSGGFNPASPIGSEAFAEEHSWQIEAGLKSAWGNGRVIANAAFFSINWTDMQLNVPNPEVPAQFYVANVGTARSTGVELELTGRASADLDLFGSAGLTHARFKDDSALGTTSIADNNLPNTPDYTTTVGARYHHTVSGNLAIVARGDVALTGSFMYDPENGASQDAYSLTNLRAGVQKGKLLVEAWIKNAFDAPYVPLAFQFFGMPSGYVGEPGNPRTFGISAGVRF
jgi:iron complex outermembrane receptor protein